MNYESSKINGSEPLIISAYMDSDIVTGSHTYGPVVRELYCFECNLSGYGSIMINGKKFTIKPRDCYIVRPGDTVSYTRDASDPRRGIWCFVSGNRVGELLDRAKITSDSPFVSSEFFEDFCRILNKIYEIREDTNLGAELRRTSLVYEMLSLLNRDTPIVSKRHWVNRAIAIFEADYPEKITVSDVADRLGFERTYFSVIFKEKTGISPHAYLTSMRIAKAKKLLSENAYSVGEAAEAVGLDARNFSRFFKRETGVSPKEYKK